MRGPNAEAHGVECGSNSTGNSEEHVLMYADVVVAAARSKQYLTWRGQYPSAAKLVGWIESSHCSSVASNVAGSIAWGKASEC